MATDLRQLASALADTFSGRETVYPESFPLANIEDLKRSGLHGAPFSRAQGGRDASLQDCAIALERVAIGSASTALLLAMPLGLAVVYATPFEPPAQAPNGLV